MFIRKMSFFKFILSYTQDIFHTQCIIFILFISLCIIKFCLNVWHMLLELWNIYFLLPLVMFRRKPYIQELVLFLLDLSGTRRNDLLMRQIRKMYVHMLLDFFENNSWMWRASFFTYHFWSSEIQMLLIFFRKFHFELRMAYFVNFILMSMNAFFMQLILCPLQNHKFNRFLCIYLLLNI